MKRLGKVFQLFLLLSFGIAIVCPAAPAAISPNDKPIVIVAIDKVESIELWKTELPSLRKLLQTSTCGLMNVRTGSGYHNTESGYLTIGAGTRMVSPNVSGGAFKADEFLASNKAGSFWSWSMGRQPGNDYLIVPEIGLILNRGESRDLSGAPGLLGATFRANGWKTALIGDQNSLIKSNRSAGYAIMDSTGVIDHGAVGAAVNKNDRFFPYLYRFDPELALRKLTELLKPRTLIMVEFGDFARLDLFRNQILPEHFKKLKGEAWERLDYFLGRIIEKWPDDQFRMIIVSPSIPRGGGAGRSMLAPVVIKAAGFSGGIAISGTTNWSGLVANIDLAPSLINMAGLALDKSLPGRPIRSQNAAEHISKITALNYKLQKLHAVQRSLLDWYLWMIFTGWAAITFSLALKKRIGNGFLPVIVAVVPFAMLALALFPAELWNEAGLLLLIIAFTLPLLMLKRTNQRFLALSGVLWGGLIIDQFTGWNLIRFSALGYSAVAGSRYYGIGNEYMGVLIAAALIWAHLLTKVMKSRWPALIILTLTAFTLSWPQLGVNFGGALAGLFGFTYYGLMLYGLKWKRTNIGAVCGGIMLLTALIGWWDSLRQPDLQTHFGRFFKLLIDLDLARTFEIISRKAALNLKLLVFSPWTRTILLVPVVFLLKRLFLKKKVVPDAELPLWRSILVAGLAALAINDSGVVAFGTCLALSFSYYLSIVEESVFSGEAETGIGSR
ncbi:MAG: hypothetical protein GX075_02835 [Firmicutes bacterium]|nr:hypothetical protein [Bacillota bacterium]